MVVIHDPPGTEKTTTVVELIHQAVFRDLKVLSCAPSNIAVDNLVERLSSRQGKSAPRILHVGHPVRLLPSVLSNSLDAKTEQTEGTGIVRDVKQELQKAQKQFFTREKRRPLSAPAPATQRGGRRCPRLDERGNSI